MTNEEIIKLSALEAGKKIKAGELTSVEITKAYLDKIAADNSKYNCYITVCDDALDQAKEADEGIKSGKYTGPLAGVPIAITSPPFSPLSGPKSII